MFKKPSQKTAISSVVSVGSAAAGGMLSDGAVTFLGDKLGSVNTARGVIAGTALVALSAVSGTDVAAKAVKGALVGVSVVQSIALVRDYAVKSGLLNPVIASTTENPVEVKKTDRVIAATFGLKCPCDAAPKPYAVPTVTRTIPSALNAVELDANKARLMDFGIKNQVEVSANAFA